MTKLEFAPGSIAEAYDINTPAGRRRLFNQRIEELTAPKGDGVKRLTLDQALFEMRTGGNADDYALLEAMGERPSYSRTEHLKTEKLNQNLDRLAQESLQVGKTAPEVAAAMSRNVAFNSRIDELTRKGFSTDQAILQMRANPKDAEMLKQMGASSE